MNSSFISSSEICNTDLTALHGEKGKVLGSHPVLAQEGKDHLALLDLKAVEKPQGTSSDRADSTAAPCDSPSSPVSFPERPAPLSKKTGQVEEQVNRDQESEDAKEAPTGKKQTESGAGGRFTLLTAQKPPTEQCKAEGICTYSLSPSEVSGGSNTEKDSPESPFEVIIDKAAFDKKFKDSYKESMKEFGRWAVHTDGESSADSLESNDKVFPLRNKEAGRYPASALLTRQFSHTTAALEEVSRCVNDMHNFTNEVLTWDLVTQVRQQADKSSDNITKTTGPDVNEYHPEIPVVNLKTNVHQKIPVCSINGNTSITKPIGDWAEASFPQKNTIVEKPIPDHLSSTEEVSMKDVQGSVQKQGGTPSELPRSPFEKCVSLASGVATMKVALPDDHLKDEVGWQSSVLGEIAEADSSGESDDTVIEDITADTPLENNKIQAENPVSMPSAVVKTSQREIKAVPSCKREKKIPENFEEWVSDSEPHQGQPGILGRNPVGEVVCSQVPDVNTLPEGGVRSESISKGAPKKPVTSENPKLPSAASPSILKETEVTNPASLESLFGKDVKDIDDSSPEDLITAFTETREKGTVDKGERNAFEAASQKIIDFKTALPTEALHESECGSSEIKDIESKYSEPSKGTNESELLNVFPTQTIPVASLDLEQEQLTIRALKELGERQVEKSDSAQNGVESPSEETLKQAFAPESWPQRSRDIAAHTDIKTESDLGISKKPTINKEASRVDNISSLSKTEVVNTHALARLLTNFSGNNLH